MTPVVYDAAVLVAADRSDRQTWLDHRSRVALAITPLVSAPVVAQVSRSSQQVLLRRFLQGCVIVPLEEADAHEAGRLLGITKTTDIVDAGLVALAARSNATILTGDPHDISRLVAAARANIEIVRV
jgi:predicted nucleic acid-binding protein